MNEKKSILKEFWRLVTITFTCTILIMSVIGWLFGDIAKEATTMFHLGSIGLPYQTIFQILTFTVINSGLSLFIGKVFKNLLLLWQLIITMFACLVASGIMVVVFRLIPPGSWASWLWFVASFVGLFIIIAAVMIIKTSLADREYEKLLTDYKAKQKKESPK